MRLITKPWMIWRVKRLICRFEPLLYQPLERNGCKGLSVAIRWRAAHEQQGAGGQSLPTMTPHVHQSKRQGLDATDARVSIQPPRRLTRAMQQCTVPVSAARLLLQYQGCRAANWASSAGSKSRYKRQRCADFTPQLTLSLCVLVHEDQSSRQDRCCSLAATAHSPSIPLQMSSCITAGPFLQGGCKPRRSALAAKDAAQQHQASQALLFWLSVRPSNRQKKLLLQGLLQVSLPTAASALGWELPVAEISAVQGL